MSVLKKIMLVDDDEIFVFLISKTIEHLKLVEQIEVFENGLDALEYFEKHKFNNEILPEIVLLDLSMPIINGWQFLDQYSKISTHLTKKIDIYICSSSISPDDIARAKTIKEITDFIIKPISKEKLIDIVNNYTSS